MRSKKAFNTVLFLLFAALLCITVTLIYMAAEDAVEQAIEQGNNELFGACFSGFMVKFIYLPCVLTEIFAFISLYRILNCEFISKRAKKINTFMLIFSCAVFVCYCIEYFCGGLSTLFLNFGYLTLFVWEYSVLALWILYLAVFPVLSVVVGRSLSRAQSA